MSRSTSSSGSMSPKTHSQDHPIESSSSEVPSSESESSTDSDYDVEDDDDSPAIIQSPTKLKYLIGHLPETTQAAIRDTFREPPNIALQKCRRISNTYAFQMTELVTHSIRIRATEETVDGTAQLTCSCRHGPEPCRHVLWLLDQISEQTLYDHDMVTPLNMTTGGYPQEMDDPFQNITRCHLDLLADGLHCPSATPYSEYHRQVSDCRVQEAREMLSSLYDISPAEFRPEIFKNPSLRKKILRRRDLDRTVFQMLLDNDHFFHYFRTLFRPMDTVNDPFYKLSQRLDRVLQTHDSSSCDPSSSQPLRDVPWVASHTIGCVRRIRHGIYSHDRPLHRRESLSAARSLVHILDAVVSRNKDVGNSKNRRDRNLYLRLIGDQESDFIINVLGLIPEAASQFLHSLDTILDRIAVYGAPATYIARFRSMLARLRNPTTGSRMKRLGQRQKGGWQLKKMK